MSAEQEERIAIAVPVLLRPQPPVRSVQFRCRRCGRPVWVSLATAPQTTGAECLPCAMTAGHLVLAVMLDETRAQLHTQGWSDEEIDAVMDRISTAAGGAKGKA